MGGDDGGDDDATDGDVVDGDGDCHGDESASSRDMIFSRRSRRLPTLNSMDWHRRGGLAQPKTPTSW